MAGSNQRKVVTPQSYAPSKPSKPDLLRKMAASPSKQSSKRLLFNAASPNQQTYPVPKKASYQTYLKLNGVSAQINGQSLTDRPSLKRNRQQSFDKSAQNSGSRKLSLDSGSQVPEHPTLQKSGSKTRATWA